MKFQKNVLVQFLQKLKKFTTIKSTIAAKSDKNKESTLLPRKNDFSVWNKNENTSWKCNFTYADKTSAVF